MNVFSCEGRIVADAQLRTTNSGQQLASFRIASNVGYGDNASTLWIDCTIWGQRAEKVVQSLVKGQQIFVNGELSERTWQKDDGTEGRALQLRVGDFSYGKSKGGEQGGMSDSTGNSNTNNGGGMDDDEIPF